MKKYSMALLAILFLLCITLVACDPATPDVPSDTSADVTEADTTEAVTDALTDTPAETTDETSAEGSTEAPTEPETEPEVPVEAIAPKKVLLTITEDVTVLDISSVSKQATLPDRSIDDVKSAFTKEGYIVAATTPANGSLLQTTVLKSLEHVVTLMQDKNGSVHVLWEKSKDVTTDPLYVPRGAEQGEVIMAQIGIAREDKDDNPMIGMCYVYRLADGTALIIDGGVNNQSCAKNLYDTLGKLDVAKDEEGKYRITAWIFTHGHSDHFDALDKVKKIFPGAKTAGFRQAEFIKDIPLDDHSTLEFGCGFIEAIHTPGHGRDSLCYIYAPDKALFTGDTLFIDCIGFCRSPKTMAQSLMRLRTFDGELVIYSGHDYGTVPFRTLKEEKMKNPEFSIDYIEKLSSK